MCVCMRVCMCVRMYHACMHARIYTPRRCECRAYTPCVCLAFCLSVPLYGHMKPGWDVASVSGILTCCDRRKRRRIMKKSATGCCRNRYPTRSRVSWWQEPCTVWQSCIQALRSKLKLGVEKKPRVKRCVLGLGPFLCLCLFLCLFASLHTCMYVHNDQKFEFGKHTHTYTHVYHTLQNQGKEAIREFVGKAAEDEIPPMSPPPPS
jgi:hypothetical protein